MNKKKIISIIAAVIAGVTSYSVVSCLNSKVEDQYHVAYKKSYVKYHSDSDQDEVVNTECYENDDVCYISVSRMATYLGQLMGFEMTSSVSNKALTVSYNRGSKKQSITIDTNTSEVTVSSPNFYTYLTNEVELAEYQEVNQYVYEYNENKITYNLKDYGLDAYWIDNKVVLPLSIFDLIFCNSISYHYYYINGEIYGDISEKNYSGMSEKNPTQSLRNLTYNYFRLMLGQYYGLSGYMGLTSDVAIQNFLSPYKEDLLSLNSSTFEQAEYNIINVALNDPHTTTFENDSDYYYSIYHNQNSQLNIEYGSRYNTIATKLQDYAQSRFLADSSANVKKIDLGSGAQIKVCNNTAFIVVNEFVYSENKDRSNIQNDTFSLMKYSIDAINNYNSFYPTNSIKNIVVDLTCNTGGIVLSGLELLSFMTNNNITWLYDYNNSGCFGKTEVIVDNDLDGYKNDYDGSTRFNWYIQTSPCSFSCANLVPFIAKNYGYAKIIGETSGGGACIVGTSVLPDGIRFNTSCPSNRNVSTYDLAGGSYRNCEDGVEPNIRVSSKNTYNYNYISILL